MSARRSHSPRLALEDLIDLEMQFQADRERDSVDLRRRDAEIGEAIDARRLATEGRDREMFVAWLRRVREASEGEPSSPGQQVRLFLDVVGFVLVLLGLGLGFGAVTGWLRMSASEPVNAIYFWAVIVGLQIAILSVWLLAVLPPSWMRRLPGAEALQVLLRLLARALPMAVAWVAAKMSPEHRLLLARIRGTLQSWGWIYGRLRFWKLVTLTQLFAVAYNVGAILAFVAISYGNDPAFGWKSRLLTPEQLHGVVKLLSLPWSSFWPAAAPTLEHVQITRFWTLDPSRTGALAAWALWWPFLLACLLFYGLIPRLVTLAISRWNARRALESIKLDHGDFFKLKERLTRPLVETQAVTPEVGVEEAVQPHHSPELARLPKDSAPALAVSRAPSLDQPPNSRTTRNVVQWAGVNLNHEAMARLVRERLGVEPAAVHTVGDLQGKGDEATLAALEDDGQGEVLMVVESWEPPIADYVDFLAAVRSVVGRERMIVILLYNRDTSGSPIPPRPQDAQVWRDQMATLGDPWLCVEELIERTQEALP